MARRRKHAIDEGDRVLAGDGLPGVPAGTPGRVLMAYGITWRRYRVDFVNGRSLSNVDARFLQAPG